MAEKVPSLPSNSQLAKASRTSQNRGSFQDPFSPLRGRDVACDREGEKLEKVPSFSDRASQLLSQVRSCKGFFAAALFLIPVATTFAQIPPHRHQHRPVKAPATKATYNPFTAPTNGTISVDINSSHALNSFAPNTAFGASVDEIGSGGLQEIFSPYNVPRMLSAGQGSLSYRLYTELNVEDWHWNPIGTWSDVTNKQGYFIGSANTHNPITESHGYVLPHRGSTYDAGDNLAYSNLTDGDASTYWKSNPYLTSTYTGESDTLHPQWAMIDLGVAKNVDAVKIQWANPYAVSYVVQYWTGDDPLFDPINGSWVTFPTGQVTSGTGGTIVLKLATSTISARYIRILMTQSSNTYDTHGTSDQRNKMGYAVFEIGVGTISSTGAFTDYVIHAKSQNQTVVVVSSTDPWHSAKNEDTSGEQIGVDYIFDGRLAQRLPATVAVPMLYSTPENAVAEMTYLSNRHYKFMGVELGEEADGQWATPEDYAALYVQWATALHKALPLLQLGGPVTTSDGITTWADSSGNTDYLSRFYGYLKSHNAANLLNFVSMEHYPNFQVPLDWSLVQQEVSDNAGIFYWVSNAGIPSTTPIYITEYNVSAASDQIIVDLQGALWHAIFTGEFMKSGGKASFYYQYFPYELSYSGVSYGLIGMYTANGFNQAHQPTSQYFSSTLMTQHWCVPGGKTHTLFPATSSITDSAGQVVVLPYVVKRPDGKYSAMLVNTDAAAHTVSITLTDTATHTFNGSIAQAQLSPANYAWISNELNGYAKPDGPLATSKITATSTTTYTLPAHSITVLTGALK
jgi:hypothetical protein